MKTIQGLWGTVIETERESKALPSLREMIKSSELERWIQGWTIKNHNWRGSNNLHLPKVVQEDALPMIGGRWV